MSSQQHLPANPSIRPGPEPDTVFTLVISSGVISSGLTLTPTEFEQVLSGGVAISNTIDSGGQVTVMSGGYTSADTILSGGTEILSTGAVAADLVVSANGFVSGTGIVDSAAIYGFAAGVSVGTDGDFYPTTIIESGGTASALTVLNTAILAVTSGVAMATIVDGGGILSVESGGLVSGSTVSNGGSLIVSCGEADATLLSYSAYAYVEGSLSSSMGGSTSTISGVLSSGKLLSGAELVIQSGGVASAIQSDIGGLIEIDSGGSLVSATLRAATISVGVSGIVSGLVLSSGSTATFEPGSEAVGARVISGTINMGPEATLVGLSLSSGSTVVDNGLIGDGPLDGQAATAVLAGQLTGSGLFAELSGGILELSGTTSNFAGEIIIGAGGRVELANAGAVNHAKLDFDNSDTSAGNYNIFLIDAADEPVNGGGFAAPIIDFNLASQDRLDLTGLAYSAGATAKVSGDILTLVDGGYTATFTLSHTRANHYDVTSDGKGGTLIFAGGGSAVPLVEAAASFQPTGGGMVLSAAEMRSAGLAMALGLSEPATRHGLG